MNFCPLWGGGGGSWAHTVKNYYSEWLFINELVSELIPLFSRRLVPLNFEPKSTCSKGSKCNLAQDSVQQPLTLNRSCIGIYLINCQGVGGWEMKRAPLSAQHSYMQHSVCKRPIWTFLETEIWRKIGEPVKKLQKIIFLILVCQATRNTHNVGRILKKSLQGSIHTQFYMAMKGPIGWFLLQLYTVSVKRRKNKFPTLRCGILVKDTFTQSYLWRPQVVETLTLCARKCPHVDDK